MRIPNWLFPIAMIAAGVLPRAASAQTPANLNALRGLAPFSALGNTTAGKAALASNYSVTGTIENGTAGQPALQPFAQQQQQALRDAFITGGNAFELADGLGSTLGGAYQSLTCYISSDDGGKSSFTSVSANISNLIGYTAALTGSDSNSGKYFFADEMVVTKTAAAPVSAVAAAIMTAAGGTTGTTEKPNAGPPETIAPGTAGTGPQKLPPGKPKPAEDPTIVIPEPEPAQDGDTETGPKSPQDSTGFDRRRKAPASARKASGKTPAGSKRKKAMIEDEEDDVGPYSGLKAAKTPRGGKRQKTTMVRAASSGLESSTVESDSGEEEPLAPPVSVRRTTRATSGTPGPTLAPPVARRAGRPKGRAGDAQLDEADEEEEVEILRSPGKRGRPQSPRKR